MGSSHGPNQHGDRPARRLAKAKRRRANQLRGGTVAGQLAKAKASRGYRRRRLGAR